VIISKKIKLVHIMIINKIYKIKFLILGIMLSTFSTMANAQEADFYNLPLPGPATLQTLDFNNVDFKPLSIPGLNQDFFYEGSELHSHVESLVNIALQSRDRNPKRWGNFSGFPEEEKVIAYIRNELENAGVGDFDVRNFDQEPWSLTTDWSVRLIGSDGQSIELESAVPTDVGTRSIIDPITAPLIYVGRGSAVDIAGKDLNGKIAVIRGEAAPNFYDFVSRENLNRLTDAGVLGVVRLWDTPGNMQLHLGACPEISCVNLGGEDSAFLEAVLAEAANAGELEEIMISLDFTVEREVRGAINMVGKISGSADTNENIVLLAHTDTWFSGADDNASGIAVLIGLANYFGRQGFNPEHDIYFIATPGHHHGAGGSSFIVENYPDIFENNIISINLEHVASTGIARIDANLMDLNRDQYGNLIASLSPTNWDSSWHGVQVSRKTPFLLDALKQASENNFYTVPANVWEASLRMPGETTALFADGALVLQSVETNYWYHSSGSMPETISPESLERALLFYKDLIIFLDRGSIDEVHAQ
jgi:hypothetical protein